MKHFTNYTTVFLTILFILGAFTFANTETMSSYSFSAQKALAFGSSGGPGGGSDGGGGSDSGCGGCGGSTAGSTGGSGSDGPDGGGGYTPSPSYVPVCEFIRFNGQTGTVTVNEGTTSGTLSWASSNAIYANLNGASVALNQSNFPVTFNDDKTWVLTVSNIYLQQDTCSVSVEVVETPDPLPVCDLTVSTSSLPAGGGQVTVSWTSNNVANDSTLWVGDTKYENVGINSGSKTVTITTDTLFQFDIWNDTGSDTCTKTVVVADPDPLPECVIASGPSTITRGETSVLRWTTTNAETATINQSIGSVAVGTNRTKNVSPNNTTTYTMTVVDDNGDTASCHTTVTVTDVPVDPVPECVISANPSSITRGETSLLKWTTTNAETATINQSIGSVAIGSNRARSVSPDNTTTYTMTVVDDNGDTASCNTTIGVTSTPTPSPFTCDDVTFQSDRTSLPRGGGDVEFTWNASDADTVSISRIGTTNLTGDETLRITNTETITLNATKDSTSINCPIRVTVDTGGGGGGSSSPRCELEISDRNITAGERITLTWDSSRASDVVITDNHGETIVTTEDRLARDKDELFDGSIRLRPTKDTTYTMVAERGSRDDECEVSVDVDGDSTVVVKEVRNQEPLVAGIALTQVPYTGFEAGPMLTTIFYMLLVVWGLFVAYVFVLRRNHLGGVSLPGSHGHTPVADATTEATSSSYESQAEAYVAQATATAPAPQNLPTAATTAPIVGYQNQQQAPEEAILAADTTELTELENRAHRQKALFSSDAMRLLLAETEVDTRDAKLDAVIHAAKDQYPSENGWVVINHERLTALMGATAASAKVEEADTVATAAGSLAEAIATGNVAAAYKMIAHRPMVALADAAAEFDAVIRSRSGAAVDITNVLNSATKDLSEADIRDAVHALTSALDGMYTNEEEAVKMAILKAVKALG